MTSLIACLSSGKGTWSHVSELIKQENWDSVFIITDEFGVENFKPDKPVEFVIINPNRYMSDLVIDIKSQLQNKIIDTEVALNLVSGSGKEHMAVLSAVLKLGLGVRLIALTPQGIKEI